MDTGCYNVDMIKTDFLEITHEMIALVSEVDTFKGAWRAVDLLAPDSLHKLRRVATIESVGSSTRIEGSKLTDQEVEKLLGRIGAKSFVTRDEQEVAGYADVMETVFNHHAAIPITESYIKQLHGMLLKYSEKDARHRGSYKSLSNGVEAFDADGKSVGVVFETSTPFDTPRHMEELVAWIKEAQESKLLHPLMIVGVFIVVFLAIHPFQDGNGRLSRVLTTLLLLKAGYEYVPYSSMETVIEANKDSYYMALRRTQGTLKADRPNWSPWLTFFLNALKKQKQRLEEKVEHERLLRASMPIWATQILSLAQQNQQITVLDVANASQTSRDTVKKRLGILVKAGRLWAQGRGRGAFYMLPLREKKDP
jgi:Fic family protein